MVRQVAAFGLVGITAVAVDWIVYRLLLAAGFPVFAGKGGGFAAGALVAYLANGRWTFRAHGGVGRRHSTRSRFLRFGLLYGFSLGANTIVNSLLLVLGGSVEAAFLAATAVSAALNFVGMKLIVFIPTAGPALLSPRT